MTPEGAQTSKILVSISKRLPSDPIRSDPIPPYPIWILFNCLATTELRKMNEVGIKKIK